MPHRSSSPVARCQSSVPSLASNAYTLPSSDPTTTRLLLTAGDDRTGPPVAAFHMDVPSVVNA